MCFFEVRHSKLGPDLLARSIANVYGSMDIFNFVQLLLHAIQSCATGEAYGNDLLREVKVATSPRFTKVNAIMSYKSFKRLAGDGFMCLGNALNPSTMNAEFVMPSSGSIVSNIILERGVKLLKKKILKLVMRDVIKGTFTTILVPEVASLAQYNHTFFLCQ